MALWTVHGDGRATASGSVAPGERLSWPLTVGFGAQHLAAMIGATILVPAATGLPVTTTLLFSGIGTLLFLVVTRNRVPGYLGASFAFIAPLAAVRGEGIPAQLGGVVAAGLLVVIIGIAVKALGVRLLESVMPPVVTGAVILLIGLNLSHTATVSFAQQPMLAVVTAGVVVVCGVVGRAMWFRFSVVIGIVVGWLLGAALGVLDTRGIDRAAWFGLPELHTPELRPSVTLVVLPVVLVLVTETVGHVKAVAALTGGNLDGNVGDSIIATGLSTTFAGLAGGAGTSTTSQNVGVMGATRVYSTASYAVTGLAAVLLSFSPKVVAVFGTVPPGVLGGATVILFGVLALVGVRVWLDHRIDLTNPANLLVVGTAVVVGVGDLTLEIGALRIGGLVWGSLLVVVLYPVVRGLRVSGSRG
ncbi:solute carrier family 23 protein [Saccharothrix violaceirubra]|uniref:Uracil-xanthine permease n=1 Tax=Saccharothrix violaceirubra TaxID=413306 RepID=A0A7W7SZZ9_9PSEU|nr:solute carrier family 23 protein [Saccharothrix violaceirubra]MBB4964078.1 uracil-xanthine permease [Saccharothrix violaceirubra]